LTVLSLAALATLAACADGPTDLSSAPENSSAPNELVITEGAAAPAYARPNRPSLSDAAAAVSSALGGSTSTPLALKASSCDGNVQTITVTYSITGRQQNPASFKVNTQWAYDGSAWAGTTPTTVSVPARAATDPATTRQVTITVTNSSATSSGTSSFSIAPFDVVTSSPAALSVTGGNVTVHVAFAACPVTNTAPALVLPNDMTVEATSSAGAAVNFVVTASDAQDGDLTSSVICAPVSGTTFALGETTVNCSVTDNGGLSASGSFTVKVVDTTPPAFSGVTESQIFSRIATNSSGWALSLSNLGISASDLVDGAVTPVCTPTDGSTLAIGAGAFSNAVSCTATDNAGNAATVNFKVEVTLNMNASGFLNPLRMVSPFSVHKRGSTIPHKFLAPTYADGTPAIDLASSIKLVVKRIDNTVSTEDVEDLDLSAGSTVWRYDLEAGQYIFNLKTNTSAPWDAGTWVTTASYKGITLATTNFDLKK